MLLLRRHIQTLTLVSGGTVLAASLFFSAKMVQVPSYPASMAPSQFAISAPPSQRILYPEFDVTPAGNARLPELASPGGADVPDAPVEELAPLEVEYVPQPLSPANPSPIEFAWAVGVDAGNPYRWLIPPGSYAESQPVLVYNITPPGPSSLQQFGGAPNGPNSGRTIQYERPDFVAIPIPEPGTLGVLLAAGLALLGGRRVWSR